MKKGGLHSRLFFFRIFMMPHKSARAAAELRQKQCGRPLRIAGM